MKKRVSNQLNNGKLSYFNLSVMGLSKNEFIRFETCGYTTIYSEMIIAFCHRLFVSARTGTCLYGKTKVSTSNKDFAGGRHSWKAFLILGIEPVERSVRDDQRVLLPRAI